MFYRPILRLALALVLSVAFGLFSASQTEAQTRTRPTVVLVHGAFAESSSWNGVIAELEGDGYRVVAAPNPLRSVRSDAATVAAVVRAIEGPVVLVGHSYGGPVITEAAAGQPNVKALVYVSAFAPDVGESALTLSGKYPGSTLADALVPVALPDGGQDLYIRPERFHAQFAADVPADQAALLAATQRPVTQAALAEPATAAAWKALPTYVIYGSADLNIPPAAMAFMAERAGARESRVVEGASHALMVSHPAEVAAMIETAAEAN